MATTAPAAAAVSAPAAAPASSDSPSTGAGAAPSAERPSYQNEDAFFGTDGGLEAQPEAGVEGEPEAEAAAAADPEALFKSTLESLPPEVRTALETRDRNLKRQAGRAAAEAKVANGNYQSAEAWARVAQAAIERARGAGADVSDLSAGEVADQTDPGRADDGDLNLMSETENAVSALNPAWAEKLLDGYEEADNLMAIAADLKAANDDPARAESLRKKARAIRSQLLVAQAQSAVWAASGVANRLHQHYGSQLGGLRGQIESGVGEATNNSLAVEALTIHSDAIDDSTGNRKWFENGFFKQDGQRRVLGDLGRELIQPMLEWMGERGLDPRDPEAFEDAFVVALRRSGKLRRAGSASAATPPASRGDATSALAGHGAPSVATPPASSPSARHQETPSELAARKNRSAFASR